MDRSRKQHLNFSGNMWLSKAAFQILLMADQKQFVLLVVRHGQGTHNLGEDHPGLKYRIGYRKFPVSGRLVKWDDSGDLDTELTEEGREEARLVGRRLAGTRFHLVAADA